MKRVYILTIQYHEDSDQIDFIQEEIIEDTPSIEYGDISLDEYFDETFETRQVHAQENRSIDSLFVFVIVDFKLPVNTYEQTAMQVRPKSFGHFAKAEDVKKQGVIASSVVDRQTEL